MEVKRQEPRDEHGVRARFLPLGDSAVCVEFGDRIDPVLNRHVLRLNALVRAVGLPGVIETIPTFPSLMVRYDPLATDSASLVAGIGNLLDGRRGDTKPATCGASPPVTRRPCSRSRCRRARKPAHYRGGHTPAQRRALQVYCRLRAGYPYMVISPNPGSAAPAVREFASRGSIAIAANMTAIYPWRAPVGHLIGATRYACSTAPPSAGSARSW